MTAAGEFGIGTASPTKTLDVRSVARVWNGTNGIELSYSTGNTSGIVASANTSGNLELRPNVGASAAMFILNNRNVGIGTITPSYKLHVASNGGYLAYFQNTSATDYRPVGFTDENNAVVGSIGYNTTNNVFSVGDTTGPVVNLVGGNVGIGTNAPSADLEVSTASGGEFLVTRSGNSGVTLQQVNGGNATSGSLSIKAGTSMSLFTGGVNRLLVDSTGKVGIGTASPNPNYKLHVYSTSTATAAGLRVQGSVTYGDGAEFAKLQLMNSVTSTTASIVAFYDGANNNTGLAFKTDASAGTYERMRIQSDGNVGIGTTAPASLLQVGGAAASLHAAADDFAIAPAVTDVGMTIRCNTTAGTGSIFFADSAATAQGQIRYNHNFDYMSFYSSGDFFFDTGSVGIGTNAPDAKLRVYGGDVTLSYSAGSNPFTLRAINDAFWMIGDNAATQEWVMSKTYAHDYAFHFKYTPGTAGAGAGIMTIGQTSKNHANYTHGITAFYTNGLERMRIAANGAIQFNSYGSGTHTGTSAYKLSVDSSGNIIETSIGAGAVDGAGTAGYIPKWTDSDTIGNSIMSGTSSAITVTNGAGGWNTGLVSINTNADSSPSMILLHKQSASPANGDYIAGFISKGRNSANQDHNYVEQWAIATNVTDGAESSKWSVGTWRSGTEYSTTLVAHAGSVGIGTGSPGEVLTLDSTSNTRLLMREGGSNKGQIAAGGGGLYIQNLAGDVIFRNISDADTVRIKNDGKVGIGTASPGNYWASAVNLVVAGSTNVGMSIVSGTSHTGAIAFADGTGTAGYRGRIEYNHSSDKLFLGAGGTTPFVLQSDDNVGIGTASPNSNVHIYTTENTVYDPSQASHQRDEGATINLQNASTTVGSFSQLLFRNRASSVGGCRIVSVLNGADSADLAIVTGDVGEAVRIDSSGNVGIGTTAPATNLHVLGTAAGSTFKFVDGNGRTLQDLGGGILSWSAASVFGSASWGSTADFEINSLTGGRQTLQVNGAAGASHSLRVTGATTAGTPTAWIHNSNNTAGADCLVVSSVSENDAEVFAVRTNTTTFGGGDTDFIVKLVSNSPRVGIGIAAPANTLHVNGQTRLGSWAKIMHTGDSTQAGYIGSGADLAFGDSNDLCLRGTDSIKFTTNDGQSDAMTIDVNGKVGIGTTLPNELLEIFNSTANGNAKIRLSAEGDTSGERALEFFEGAYNRFRIATVGANGNLEIHRSTTGDSWFATPAISIKKADGNVGIGTTAPTAQFHVQQTSNNQWAGKFKGTGTAANYGLSVDCSAGTASTSQPFFVYTPSGGPFCVMGDGKVGIGTAAPAHKLSLRDGTVGGFINPRSATSLVAMGSNTAHALQIYSGGDERIRVKTDGNVGIGTNAPKQRLHIFQTEGGVGVKHATIRLGGYLDKGAEIAAYRTSGNSNNMGLKFSANNVTNGIVDVMTLDDTGKVGIGHATPSSKLTIDDPSAQTAINLASCAVMIRAATALNQYSNIGFNYSGGVHEPQCTIGIQQKQWASYTYADLVFATRSVTTNTAPTERMRIQHDGNVGIGTTAPSRLFDVNGTSYFRDDIYFGNTVLNPASGFNTQIGMGWDKSTGQFQIAASSTTALQVGRITTAGVIQQWRYAGTVVASLESSGQVRSLSGAVSAPSFSFTNDTTTGMSRPTTGTLNFVTAGAERVRIDANGNFGIGTSAPSKTLHVYSGASGVGASSDVNMILEGASNVGLAMLAPNNQGSRIEFGSVADNNEGIIYYNNTGSYFSIYTNGTRQVDINSAGNVGIGTNAPGAKLMVGIPLRQAGSAVQQQAGYFIGTKTAYASSAYKGLWQNQLHVADDSALAAGIGGAITFGATQDNTNGTYLASIEGSRDNATSGQYGASMIFRTRTHGAALMGAHMVIASDGNVGIGTTAPAQKLHVNGNILVNAQILTPGGSNLALNPNTGLVTVGGALQASGTSLSTFGGPLTVSGNITTNGSQFYFYRAVNSGNPEFHIGSAAAERLTIQSVYASGAQTLASVSFRTSSSLGAANAGQMNFYVDDSSTEILKIQDTGIATLALTATSGAFTGANTNAATYATFQRSDAAVSSRIRYDGSTTILFGTSTNHPISFETNATPRLTISAAGTATFSGHVLPAANGTYNLGGSGNYWASCYFENTAINGTLYVGGVLTAASNVDVAQSKYLRVGGSTSTAPFSARQVSGSSMVHLMELNTGTSVQAYSFGLDTVGNYIDFVIQSEYGAGSWGERFRITKQYGCVGIGTTAPDSKLHVYGGKIHVKVTSGTGSGAHIQGYSDASTPKLLTLGTHSYGDGTLGMTTISGHGYLETYGAFDLHLRPNQSTGMVIKNGGRVGIGITPNFTPGGSRQLLQITNGSEE